MGVSNNNGTPNIHFNRVFHCKPSILGVKSPYFWKHPYEELVGGFKIHAQTLNVFTPTWGNEPKTRKSLKEKNHHPQYSM